MTIRIARTATLKRAFDRQWRLSGQLTAMVVQPYSEWDVPSGYTFNKSKLLFENASGVKLVSPETYRKTDTIHVIAASTSAHVKNMIIAGFFSTGVAEVFVLDVDLAKIRASHAVIINDIEYKETDSSGTPLGDEQWARIILERK